jgi:hypothetical protein
LSITNFDVFLEERAKLILEKLKAELQGMQAQLTEESAQ